MNVEKAGIEDIDALVKMRLDYLREDNVSSDEMEARKKRSITGQNKASKDRIVFGYSFKVFSERRDTEWIG